MSAQEDRAPHAADHVHATVFAAGPTPWVLEFVPGAAPGPALTMAESVGRALRGAVLHHASEPRLGGLAGHEVDGAPVRVPHAAFVSYPGPGAWEGGPRIGAVAVVLPRDADAAVVETVEGAVRAWEAAGCTLRLGRLGAWRLRRVGNEDARRWMQPWSGPARWWGSVTPVALDENPGDLRSARPEQVARAFRRAEEIVHRACERVGLPRPVWLRIERQSAWDRSLDAPRFMPFPRTGDGVRRVCVHVELGFTEPVCGPLLLGAGRYFGVGLLHSR